MAFRKRHKSESLLQRNISVGCQTQQIKPRLPHVSCNSRSLFVKKHVRHTKTQEIKFYNGKFPRLVLRGQCLDKTLNGCSRYVGMDTSSGELLTVVSWVFNYSQFNESTLNKQIQKITKMFHELQPLHHINLCQYLSWRKIVSSKAIHIHVLMEYCESSLSALSNNYKILPIETVRLYTSELLKALDYLHTNHIAHRNLTLSNVFIDKEGQVRLAGFDLSYKLEEICSNTIENVNEQEGNLKIAQRRDLNQLGLLVLTLVTGKPVNTFEPDIPNGSPNFSDFLIQCIQSEKFPHLKTKQLLEHAFIQEYSSIVAVRDSVHSQSMEYNDNLDTGNSIVNNEMEMLLATEPTCSISRFKSEYTYINKLGQGGFGSVIQVKNKLDGGVYAIKKIKIDPNCTKDIKMIREVKLLSTLKHKNIVSYHGSWLESGDEEMSAASTPASSFLSDSAHSANISEEAEALAPDENCKLQEWKSVDNPEDMKSKRIDNTKNNEEIRESKDKENSESVQFCDEENDCQALANCGKKLKKMLYIKMECCEGRTLRNAINEGLFDDIDRVWRLFGEIVEGLAHIHEKNIIHRDLNPLNIFLDASDHVKIGDFGLARRKVAVSNEACPAVLTVTQSQLKSCKDKGSLTSAVGTSYYISPEAKTSKDYNEKADIYSLGIIYFEMCYRPFPTEYERSIVLSNLRSSSIIFPDDFKNPDKTKQIELIKKLLSHNPQMRHTANEILCLYFPSMSSSGTTTESLTDMLRFTSSNLKSNSFKHILKTVFSQVIPNFEMLTYDLFMYEKIRSPQISLLFQKLKLDLEKVFTKLGATSLSLPVLIPKSDVYEGKPVVHLMDSKGGLFTLPYDLRVPFARYIGQENVVYMKRFTIEKIFLEHRQSSSFSITPPEEYTECAFDIVSPCCSLIPDAEVLYAVQEIINMLNVKLQALNKTKLKALIQINHMSLMKALLLHYGVQESDHNDVLTALMKTRKNFSRAQALQTLESNIVTQESLPGLLKDLNIKGSKREVKQKLKHILESTHEVQSLATRSFKEMDTIVAYAANLGCKLQISYSLSIVLEPNVYSGFIFQVLHKSCKRGKSVSGVLARGGRYDKLITNFANYPFTSSGVGASLLLENLASLIAKHEQDLMPCDILLLVESKDRVIIKKTLATAKNLRDAGFKTEVISDIQKTLMLGLTVSTRAPMFVFINENFPIVTVYSLTTKEFLSLHINELALCLRTKSSTGVKYLTL